MSASGTDAAGGARARRALLLGDLLAAVSVIAAGAAGYGLMPDNLALLTRVVALALLTLSLFLVTGLGGIATLGQATLFGSGAYAAGIACVSFGVTEPLGLLAIGAIGGGAAGLVSGAIILRGTGLSQLVLSIALVLLAHEAANKLSAWTGGSDGLAGVSPGDLFGLFPFDLWGRTGYGLGLGLLLAVVLGLRVLVRSPFGMLCRGIRQDPVRIRAMGAPVTGTLLRLYGVSGLVAGLGGALSAVSTGVVGLDSLSFGLSAEALVMLVLGGAGSLPGALVGTAAFTLFQHHVSSWNPFGWLMLVGALLIAVVLAAPEGIAGTAGALARRLFPRGRR